MDRGIYKFFLVLHLLSVIIGFGAFMALSASAWLGDRRVGTLDNRTTRIAEYSMYAVPILGFGLVGLSDKVIKFSQVWIWLSLILWIAIVGVYHGMIRPARGVDEQRVL